jgi:hypothetical protein
VCVCVVCVCVGGGGGQWGEVGGMHMEALKGKRWGTRTRHRGEHHGVVQGASVTPGAEECGEQQPEWGQMRVRTYMGGREGQAQGSGATHQQLGAGEGQEGAQVHRPSTDAAIRHLRQRPRRRQRQQPAHDGAQGRQHLGRQRCAAQDVGAGVSVRDMQAWGRGV